MALMDFETVLTAGPLRLAKCQILLASDLKRRRRSVSN